MGGGRRGRPRKDDNGNGSIHDYAIYLALIWKADGNVSKAAVDLGHEGTKSFYNAIARLRKHINGDTLKTDPNYDYLYKYDKKLKEPTWTENGVKLVRIGEELFNTKKRYNDDDGKTRLQNAHFANCKTPLYKTTEILVTLPGRESNFEIFYACRSCFLMMRNFRTLEFMKWRYEHPEIYSGLNAPFSEVRDPTSKYG